MHKKKAQIHTWIKNLLATGKYPGLTIGQVWNTLMWKLAQEQRKDLGTAREWLTQRFDELLAHYQCHTQTKAQRRQSNLRQMIGCCLPETDPDRHYIIEQIYPLIDGLHQRTTEIKAAIRRVLPQFTQPLLMRREIRA